MLKETESWGFVTGSTGGGIDWEQRGGIFATGRGGGGKGKGRKKV